jgi:hypothetical protein
MTIRKFPDGWKWKEGLQGNAPDDEHMQFLQTEKMEDVHHYHKGDKRLDLPKFVASMQTESNFAGMSMVELADELKTLNRFMYIVENEMCGLPPQDFVNNFNFWRDCQDQGIEVLTMGNNDYSIVGLKHGGRLKNAVSDAQAVAEAFREVGAHVRTKIDVRDCNILETDVRDWADTRLRPDVRVVFVYWAGHAFHCKGDGMTHIVPTGQNWNIKSLKAGRDTMPVKDIVDMLRERSQKCKLVICLDSCRTEMDAQNWTSVQRPEGGPDLKLHEGVEIWYSTAHGEVASDGTAAASHSHFAESILKCLQKDLQNKTFDDLWKEILREMKQRDPTQLPSRYTSGASDHETLLLPVVVPRQPEEDHIKQVS